MTDQEKYIQLLSQYGLIQFNQKALQIEADKLFQQIIELKAKHKETK